MKIRSLGSRVTALTSVVLFCLSASSHRLARRVDARSTRVGSGASDTTDSATPRTCTDGNELQLSGAKESFKIKCPDGSQPILTPVETTTPSVSGRQESAYNLDDVYAVSQANRTGTGKKCGADKAVVKLSQLAPGSTLAADGAVSSKQLAQDSEDNDHAGQEQVAATVFTLNLGDRQVDDRHFCYICAANTTVPGGGRQSSCTIFVTLPKKENPGTTDPTPDSSSLCPHVFGWLALSGIGCVLGLIPHL